MAGESTAITMPTAKFVPEKEGGGTGRKRLSFQAPSRPQTVGGFLISGGVIMLSPARPLVQLRLELRTLVASNCANFLVNLH